VQPILIHTVVLFFVVALTSFPTFAQTDPSLATPAANEVNVSVGHYTYTEPGAQSISIHGVKIGGEYTATLLLDRRRHWFAQANVRGAFGNVTYDGWCSPFLIRPNNASPNGYEVGFGAPSPCSEDGDRDWYLEGRALVGKDLLGVTWAWSPYGGLGVRHLSNGTTGTPGYRTDEYLYLAAGLTARTRVARRVVNFTVEYDRLLHGWQTTRGSALGGGTIPSTRTAPAFTIDSFSDVSFSQEGGWALRAGAKYQVMRRWSLEPYYGRWNVAASPVAEQTITFTVNRVTAQQRIGFFEPVNATDEFGVKFGFGF